MKVVSLFVCGVFVFMFPTVESVDTDCGLSSSNICIAGSQERVKCPPYPFCTWVPNCNDPIICR